MEELIDKTAKVREGEELPAETIRDYLKEHIPDLEGDIEIEQFPSGHSNLTYLVRIGDREMVLRRPPFGSHVKTAHDMGREYRILSGLYPVFPRVPRPLVFCEDESVIGARFYVMERLRGIILRRKVPEGMEIPPETASKLCESFVQTLAEIHAVDYEAAGLADLGKPKGYLYRQVHGWSERYYGSQTDDIEGVDRVISWLQDNLPESPEPVLVQNDYKYDNLVLAPDDITRIIGVLDWEMSTIGDPLTDLGGSLGYWVEADDPDELQALAFGPTMIPGSWTRKQIAERYAELTGRDVSNIHYYTVFATFKIMVIIQQIYYRYAKGLTKDERFAPLIEGVKILNRTSNTLIDQGHI
ncbi:MAG: phosphotransferase family protein [bacterium]